jgi:hypothetical protein
MKKNFFFFLFVGKGEKKKTPLMDMHAPRNFFINAFKISLSESHCLGSALMYRGEHVQLL